MINIYDEVGHIKNVLENGFSRRWQEDAKLLVKYYRNNGEKKKDIKEKIKKKCEMYIPEYNKFTMFNTVNKIVESAWKDKTPLREIKQVETSKEVLDWFLNLEKQKVSEKQLEEIKAKKPSSHVTSKFWNFNKVKMLFTLYIWALIQKNYLENYWMIQIERYGKQFKEDANLPSGFNILKESNNLYDLGYIFINSYRNIDIKFREFDIFKIPITDENRIIISGEDLYKCGYWLEKKKMGSFICQRCGKEFAHYSNNKNEKQRKYCKECKDNILNGRTEKIIINCVDCNKEIIILKRNHKTCRCKECQNKRNKKLHSDRQKNIKIKNDDTTPYSSI